MIRRALVGLLLGLAILAASGCGKTATISVMAQPWGTGQHQDCIYAHDNIYCIMPTANEVMGRRLDRAVYVKDKKPVPRTEVLFGMGFELVRNMEKLRPKIKDGEADTGTYETRFSASPVDYSLWDCNKTGSASPAISCKLTKKPEGKSLEFIEKKKAQAAADDFLRALTKEELARRCGAPVNSTQDSISYSVFYATTSGMPLSFRFDTFSSHPSLDMVESEETRDKDAARHIFWWASSNSSLDETALITKEFPCLNPKP
jgi:hypothetical protein